jgi:hypothetical protein
MHLRSRIPAHVELGDQAARELTEGDGFGRESRGSLTNQGRLPDGIAAPHRYSPWQGARRAAVRDRTRVLPLIAVTLIRPIDHLPLSRKARGRHERGVATRLQAQARRIGAAEGNS